MGSEERPQLYVQDGTKLIGFKLATQEEIKMACACSCHFNCCDCNTGVPRDVPKPLGSVGWAPVNPHVRRLDLSEAQVAMLHARLEREFGGFPLVLTWAYHNDAMLALWRSEQNEAVKEAFRVLAKALTDFGAISVDGNSMFQAHRA